MTPSDTHPQLLTSREAAEVLTISPRTLHTLTASGQIPHVRIGHLVRYSIDDLRQWIAERTTGGAR